MKKLCSLLLILLTLVLTSCNPLVIKYSPTIFALHTTIDVTFYNVDDYETHYKRVKEIYQEVDRYAGDFTEGFYNNSVFDLNKNREIEAPDILLDMLNISLELMDETNGYFNPFIGRLSHIWKEAIASKTLPEDDLIKAELEIMNNTTLEINGNMVKLIGEGNVDLGGMAKGYATEKARLYLEEAGVTSYMINAGSSNILAGDKNKEDFVIGLTDPNTSNIITTITGKGINIATSSYEHQGFIVDDIMYHHLISPFTGYPVNNYSSASVWTDDACKGDVYSTAIFLMDYEDIKKLKDIKIVLIKDSKILYNTFI